MWNNSSITLLSSFAMMSIGGFMLLIDISFETYKFRDVVLPFIYIGFGFAGLTILFFILEGRKEKQEKT